MILLGLTGSIGTGKSTVAKHFARFNIPIFDSDLSVHELLKDNNDLKQAIKNIFPKAIKGNEIDRSLLGQEVFNDKDKLTLLEELIHPFVFEEQRKFIHKYKRQNVKIALMDIPLLFEKNREKYFSYIITTCCTSFLQRKRVLSRPHMTEEKFYAILRHQLPTSLKKNLSDFVIQTGLGKHYSLKQVQKILDEIGKTHG